jgi:hypothetical protein
MIADAVAVIVVVGFLVFVIVALAKPFLHAIRAGGVESDSHLVPTLVSESGWDEEPPAWDEDDPAWGDDPPSWGGSGSSGVREPRRPRPGGSAGAMALKRDDPIEAIDAVASEARPHADDSGGARAA